ncbi:MAG TPA: group 1 truncated hemoglobin [Gemmatimonadaceae bacterium]|nr:group 1 truncated hemoglobin [Gemmatimonadaceae bacterium]
MPISVRRHLLATAIVSALLGACASVQHPAPEPSLYARLGGYEAIAAVVDDILARELKDPVIAPFFKGLEPADLQRIRQHLVDQLCAVAKGPCFYPGRDMKTVHAEMEITNDVWNAFTGHIGETLAAFRIGERERNELVMIVSSLKQDIVHPPSP